MLMTPYCKLQERVEFCKRILCKKKDLCVPVFRVRLHFLKHGLIKHV